MSRSSTGTTLDTKFDTTIEMSEERVSPNVSSPSSQHPKVHGHSPKNNNMEDDVIQLCDEEARVAFDKLGSNSQSGKGTASKVEKR